MKVWLVNQMTAKRKRGYCDYAGGKEDDLREHKSSIQDTENKYIRKIEH